MYSCLANETVFRFLIEKCIVSKFCHFLFVAARFRLKLLVGKFEISKTYQYFGLFDAAKIC